MTFSGRRLTLPAYRAAQRHALLASADFAGLPDGAIPSGFGGATFSVSGGLLVNTPSVGAELLTTPSFEGLTFVAGKAPNLTFVSGSPTFVESADTHGGTKAQQVTATAQLNKAAFANVAGIVNAYWRFSGWLKRTSGTGTNTRMQVEHAALMPQVSSIATAYNVASYTQKSVSYITTSTANMTPEILFEAGTSGFNTVIGDDFSLKRLTFADLFALYSATQANVVVRVIPNALADQTLSGIVARADAQSSPTAMLIAFWRWNAAETQITISLVELAGGTYTRHISETSVNFVAGATLELYVSGTTARLFYAGSQVGTDKTVSATGAFHGVIITGGNNIRQFSLARAA